MSMYVTQTDIDFAEGLLDKAGIKTNKVKRTDILDRYSDVDWAVDFILNESPQILVMGGRRGAKTTNLSAKIGFTDLFRNPGINDSFIFYASKTFEHAMGLMWKKLVNFRDFFGIEDWNMNRESSGIIQTPRSEIKIMGFNDIDSIGKALGQPFKLFAIDEAQEIRSDILQTIVRDAGSWGTLDSSGSLILCGNPPRTKFHFFAQEWLAGRSKNYHTSLFKNPFLNKEAKEKFLDEQRSLRGEKKGEESPEFCRMAFGDIVFESSHSVFTVTDDNYYENPPENLQYIIGVDLGWRAHDAIVVIGWHKTSLKEPGCAYLIEEHQAKRQSFESLGAQVDRIAERYGANTIIMDTGGLAVKAVPDLTARYSKRHWVAAEKKDKVAWIRLLQTELIHKRFKMKDNALFLKEVPLIEWDETHEKINDKIHHSDLLDAILYTVRYCLTNLQDITKTETDITRLWSDDKKKLAFRNIEDNSWGAMKANEDAWTSGSDAW